MSKPATKTAKPAAKSAAKPAAAPEIFNPAHDAADMRAAIAFARASEKAGKNLGDSLKSCASAAFGAEYKTTFAPLAAAIGNGKGADWTTDNPAAPAAKFYRHWDALAKAAADSIGLKNDDRRRVVNPFIRTLRDWCYRAGGSPAKADGAATPAPKGGAVPAASHNTADETRGEPDALARAHAAGVVTTRDEMLRANVHLWRDVLCDLSDIAHGRRALNAGDETRIRQALAALDDTIRTYAPKAPAEPAKAKVTKPRTSRGDVPAKRAA
jgi:hypothetical protein